jgi:hypothetical protein
MINRLLLAVAWAGTVVENPGKAPAGSQGIGTRAISPLYCSKSRRIAGTLEPFVPGAALLWVINSCQQLLQ